MERLPGNTEVHVWFVELVGSAACVQTCAQSLSSDERTRASRFRFEHLKTGFTLSRGILRALLGYYLNTGPAQVRFSYGRRGKPGISAPGTALKFNQAHSGRFAAYAFATGCEIGVDIEEMRTMTDQEGVVRQFFSPSEGVEWRALDVSERQAAFFRCWTGKEAYIKALGDGLSLGLDTFRVSLRPDTPAALIQSDADPHASERWSLYTLTPAEGYCGTLAVPERGRTLRILPRKSAGEILEIVKNRGPLPAPAAV